MTPRAGLNQPSESYKRMGLLTDWLYPDLTTNPETVYAAFYETVKEYDARRTPDDYSEGN